MPAACAWSTLWWYSRLAVKDCQSSIFSTLACALHCLAAHHWRPQSQQTHISEPGKATRTMPALTLQISAKNLSWTQQGYLVHREHVGQLVLLVSQRTPVRCSQRANKEQQPLTRYQFRIDVHLQESSNSGRGPIFVLEIRG